MLLKNLSSSFAILKGFVGILRDPSNTESIFDIGQGMQDSEAFKQSLLYMKSQPEVAEAIANRYLASPIDLDALMQLPPDSLGYAYASYLKSQNFDAEFYPPIQVKDDLSYVMLRLRQTHDIWHIVADFNTKPNGELGLQSFMLAQLHYPLSVLLLAGGMLKVLFHSAGDLGALLDQIALGYHKGVKAKPFLAQQWEEHWERSVLDWRQKLNVDIL
jgi:ubiquinone biosynthesis protein COQ4